jgi:hypothetical protein
MVSVSGAVDLLSITACNTHECLENGQTGSATTLTELFRGEGSASEERAQKRRKLNGEAKLGLEPAEAFNSSHSVVLANVDLQLVGLL